MANGDITKEIEYDKIEVVSTWNIQVRKATKIMEEGAGGVKTELSRSFNRHVLQPFNSVKAEDDRSEDRRAGKECQHPSRYGMAPAE